MAVEIGDEAPDFELPDQNKNTVRLSDFRGKSSVVLVFYPFAFTPVCEGEMCALRDERPAFDNEGAEIIGISCDSSYTLKAWSDANGFDFPIVADRWPLGAVAHAYGVFDDSLGCAIRATFVIDHDGRVQEKVVSPNLATARDTADYHKALASLS